MGSHDPDAARPTQPHCVHQLRQLVIRDPSQLDGVPRRGDTLDIGPGDRQELHHVWVPVHHLEAHIEMGGAGFARPYLLYWLPPNEALVLRSSR